MFEAEYLEPEDLLPALPVVVKGVLDVKSPNFRAVGQRDSVPQAQAASPNAAPRKALSGSFADYFSRLASPVVTPDPALNKALSGSFAAYLDSNAQESGHLEARLTKELSRSFAAYLDPEPAASDLGTMSLNRDHQRSDTPLPTDCAGGAAQSSRRRSRREWDERAVFAQHHLNALLQQIEEAPLPQLVTVLRAGERKAVEACDLLPGDVVQL